MLNTWSEVQETGSYSCSARFVCPRVRFVYRPSLNALTLNAYVCMPYAG